MIGLDISKHSAEVVNHRQGLVTQRTQGKNRVHAILHRNLVTADVSDLFGKAGRVFPANVEPPGPERKLLEADLRTIDDHPHQPTKKARSRTSENTP